MTESARDNTGNIDKKEIKPSAFLNPVPLVMCSSGDMDKGNIITLAWCGTVNSDPPMISVSIRKSRFSHDMIVNSGHACINLVSGELTRAADFCGVRSGRDIDKFAATGLTKVRSPIHGVPMVGESPVNIECTLKQVIELGSHDMFLLNVDAVYVSQRLFDKKGAVDLKKAGLIAYSHGEYYELGKILGFYGFSVAGDEALRRRKR
jgi:flavin reductase (DIM6/NTAB) family NADH-FMN oxidoreductase RutF